jgi:hypothetical protein
MFRRKAGLAVCVGVLLLISALVVGVAVGGMTANSAPEPVSGQVPGPAVNIDRPFVDGVAVGVGDASSVAGFAAVLPKHSGSLIASYVHSSDTSPEDQAIGLVYDNGTSRFDVIEDTTKMTQTDLASLAGCDHSLGCVGAWTMVQLQDGTQALEIAGPQTNGLIWLHGDRRFDVFGPATSFSVEAAVSASNDVESSTT